MSRVSEEAIRKIVREAARDGWSPKIVFTVQDMDRGRNVRTEVTTDYANENVTITFGNAMTLTLNPEDAEDLSGAINEVLRFLERY